MTPKSEEAARVGGFLRSPEGQAGVRTSGLGGRATQDGGSTDRSVPRPRSMDRLRGRVARPHAASVRSISHVRTFGETRKDSSEPSETQRTTAQNVVLRDLDMVELKGAHGLLQQDHASNDRGSAVGVQADDVATLLVSHVSETSKEQIDGGEQERVAVHARRIVRVELEIDGGGGGGGASDGDATRDGRALLRRQTVEKDLAGVECELL